MNEQKFTELLGHIDPALIARAEESVPMRQKPIFRRALIAAVAAMLALTMCASLIIIPFIPTTLGLDYLTSPSDDTEIAFIEQNAWIYYVENGKQKREYVRLPGDTQNVFMAWKHLNGLDENAELLDVSWTTDAENQRQVQVQLSTALREHPNSEALLDSLQKTLARSFGVMTQNVSFVFNDTVASPLLFYHTYRSGESVTAGSRIDIEVGMTNVSDEDIVFTGAWSDFVPKAKLRANSIIYTEQLLLPLPTEGTDDISEYRLAPGKSHMATYTFEIPADVPSGTYDLIISFGEYSWTFEDTVEVVGLTVPGNEYLQFAEFLNNYGFTSADPTAFKQAVKNLSYQGVNLFELMNEAEADRAPEIIECEYWRSELFDYDYFVYAPDGIIQSYHNNLKAMALPDGMELPCGIQQDDLLINAMFKVSVDVDQSNAQDLLEAKQDVLISGYPKRGIWLKFEEKYTVIAYMNTVAQITPGQNGNQQITTKELKLYYDADTGKFVQFIIKIEQEIIPSGLFEGTPIFTYILGEPADLVITGENAERLLDILNNGKWVNEILIWDEGPGYTCEIGNYSLHFTEGFFMIDGYSLELTMEQLTFVSKLLRNASSGNAFTGPIEFDYPGNPTDFLCRLTDEHLEEVLHILNNTPAQSGTLEFDCDYPMYINGQEFGYSSSQGVLGNHDIFLHLTEQDRQTINAILVLYEIIVQE